MCSVAAALTAGMAVAAPIPTILGTSTAAFTGYEFPNAVDTGATNLLTDYAANVVNTNGLGLVNLDFDFSAPLVFTSIRYTDRTTSGSLGNGIAPTTFLTTNFATSIEYFFCSDAAFSSCVNTGVINRPVPPSPTNPLDYQTTTEISNISARYVRFEILSFTGPGIHPGAADFAFTETPEPSTGIWLGLGFLVGFAFVRRRCFQA
jgi:hypothetical protein